MASSGSHRSNPLSPRRRRAGIPLCRSWSRTWRMYAMIPQCGRVEMVFPGRALVKLETWQACGACAAHGNCRPEAGTRRERFVEVIDPIGVQRGDRVEIHFSSTALWMGILFCLAIPGGAMVVGAVVGWFWGPGFGGSATAAAAGFLALGATFAAGLLIYRRKFGADRYLPRIVRSLAKGSQAAMSTPPGCEASKVLV